MTIQPDDLLVSLARTSRMVIQYDADGRKIGILAPLQAISVIRNNPHIGFTRAGKFGQVRSIQPLSGGKLLPWRRCWRTAQAAALPTYGYDRRSAA
jgi:hypothetical protein